jgi:hypothetical protein
MSDAKIMTIDFSKAASIRFHKSGRIRDRGMIAARCPQMANC